MGKWDNVTSRREHKERSQPHARKHLGFLEKKKDYKKRAVAYHKKQDSLQKLRLHAALKNPDEFRFGMVSSKVNEKGKHHSTKSEGLDNKTTANMRGQDIRYLEMQMAKEKSTIDKMRRSTELTSDRSAASEHFRRQQGEETDSDSEEESLEKATHMVFVDSKKKKKKFDIVKYYDTVPELMVAGQVPLTKEQLENVDLDILTAKALKIQAQKRTNKLLALEARVKRRKAMVKVTGKIRSKRVLQTAKGSKVKVQAAGRHGTSAVFKWRNERAR